MNDTPIISRPVFIYDGQCGFCRCWIARWRHVVGEAVEFAPFQEAADRFLQIDRESFGQAVHLIEADGRVSRGAAAVFRMFAVAGKRRWRFWAYEHISGVAPVSEAAYRFVAGHRPLMSRFMQCGTDPLNDPRAMHLTRWLFLRALAIVYLLAFGSLLPQILGLVGSDGIMPAQKFLTAVSSQIGVERYWKLPTLCWWSASDVVLRYLCIGGMALSVLLIFDIAPALILFLLWVFYLSLVQIGDVFLFFQWDALLLETGLLAIFLAPLYIVPRLGRLAPAPSPITIWLLRWLLFRLMLLSGVVKLASGDKTWQDLTALTVHYETQPLSNWVAWHFHQAPQWFHKFSCWVMYFVELGLPFCIFFGRWGRRIAFGGFVFLQLIIILTGNYGFFNVLTLALCILLLDDGFWPVALRRWHARKGLRSAWAWPAWILSPVAVVVLLLTLVPVFFRVGVKVPWPQPVTDLYRVTAPMRSFNAYGLFASMTHSRPEIIVEGSNDGRRWKAYEFRFKPGEPSRYPPFVAPHMPRLDWQMWFAALSSVNREQWFVFFCERLLEGSPSVLGLMEHNPFPDKPPRYVRALKYDYRFTDRATRAADGRWWRRTYKGIYCPPLDLNLFRRRGM